MLSPSLTCAGGSCDPAPGLRVPRPHLLQRAPVVSPPGVDAAAAGGHGLHLPQVVQPRPRPRPLVAQQVAALAVVALAGPVVPALAVVAVPVHRAALPVDGVGGQVVPRLGGAPRPRPAPGPGPALAGVALAALHGVHPAVEPVHHHALQRDT